MTITKPKFSLRSFTLLLAAVTLPLSSLSLVFDASASPVRGWQAGNIMENHIMANANTMSVGEIQNFLELKVPDCDTYGQQLSEYGGPDLNSDGRVQRWEWGKANYNQTKFVCLRDYSQDGRSAAQIIYDASQQYSINPQVLLVLLQKEQGLIQDEWPLNIQYRSATGYGCPDTAPCDSDYYGLTNQIKWAATMFRAILNDSPTWYTPYELGWNYIQYNPSSSCGGSSVYIQNRATQALYNYTPYQPNDAALDAGWGTAPCGAYGNRNFYLYFTSWFGSTRVNLDFRFERLAGSSSAVLPSTGNLGEYTETISAGDTLHTFFYDSETGSLQHAWYVNGEWQTKDLDGVGQTENGGTSANVGQYVTGFYDASKKTVEIFYYNATSKSLRNGTLHINENEWEFTDIDGVDSSIEGAISADVGKGIAAVEYYGGIQIYYYDATNGDMRHAWKNGNLWSFESLDGSTNSISKKSSNTGKSPTITRFNGQLQLYYYDVTNSALRHAWWHKDTWQFEYLDGHSNSLTGRVTDTGMEPSVGLYNGNLQLYYYDVNTGNLRHAWWGWNRWNFENLDGTPRTILQVDSNTGRKPVIKQFGKDLYVFYYDVTRSVWRLAYWNTKKWQGFDLDGSEISLSQSAATVSGELSAAVYDGSIQTYYQDNTDSLRHAWFHK